jgi:hypothetical protein
MACSSKAKEKGIKKNVNGPTNNLAAPIYLTAVE